MNTKTIGSVLKYYRKLRNLSVKDVSDYLSENNFGVSVKTIYGWENNHAQPDNQALLLLCRLYRIENILDAFGYGSSVPACDIVLTSHEIQLVKQYRKNPDLQPAIDKILDI